MTTKTNLSCTLAAVTLVLSVFACGNNVKPTSAGAGEAAVSTSGKEQSQNQRTVSEQPSTGEPAKEIPEFTFYMLRSGIRFTKQDLAKNGNSVFIFFDPTCSHCQHEARDLGQRYNEVKDANFYFVSMNDPALMNTFLETFAKPLVGKPNVEVLYDRGADFINKFHIPSQYPATYIYGENGQLKTYWNGERKIDEIISAILN